jgi:hypothetical protein
MNGTTAEISTDPTITSSDGIVTPIDIAQFHGDTRAGSGEGIKLVVRDSGIDETHPLFESVGVNVTKPNIGGLPTNGEDNVGHGTATAGLWALMAPGLEEVISVPIFSKSGRTNMDTIERSYEYIIDTFAGDNSEVMVNDSWGARREIAKIDDWHNEMERVGINSVAAAGNTDQQTGSPATAERAFSVSACRLDGSMARFSSPTDNLAAVGVDIAVPQAEGTSMGQPIDEDNYDAAMNSIGGEWTKASGTSFAAPIVGGFASAYNSRPRADALSDPDAVMPFEKAFLKTAKDIEGTKEDGEGRLDYHAAKETERPPEGDGERTVNGSVLDLGDAPMVPGNIIALEDAVLENGDYEFTVGDLKESANRK